MDIVTQVVTFIIAGVLVFLKLWIWLVLVIPVLVLILLNSFGLLPDIWPFTQMNFI